MGKKLTIIGSSCRSSETLRPIMKTVSEEKEKFYQTALLYLTLRKSLPVYLKM